MKYLKLVFVTCLLLVMLIPMGCDQILSEQPRADLTPDYFRTAQGLERGLTAAYSGMRYQYGTEGAMSLTVLGGDTYTTGGQANDGQIGINGYTTTLNPQNGQFQNPWANNYTYINTTNGIIQYGQDVTGLSDSEKNSLISQAKYLRASYYFLLVRMFGGVPLDLGSGELQFNTTPETTSERNSLGEVYNVIITDLTEAIDNLPPEASQAGRADQAAAKHLLAKVYLTRGWSDAAESGDYQNAYDQAMDLIDNRGTYGLDLEEDFAAVHEQGNEHGVESIWTVERTSDLTFNESAPNAPNDGLKENRSNYLFHPYYEVQSVTVGGDEINPVVRTMEYQRPWIRFRPTEFLLEDVFDNRDEDSRFDDSFRTMWRVNTDNEDVMEHFSVGDTAFYMPSPQEWADNQTELENKEYRVFPPDGYLDNMYPDLTKFDDTEREDIAYASTRPFIVHRFAETLLIAAEAALQDGSAGDAVPLLNELRRRAARSGQESNMEITTADVDIDFILNERARELVGEQMRWFDLVRTNKLVERVQAHNPEGGNNVQPYHSLRPIPQSQIDLMDGDNANAESYQNEGYY